MPPQSGVNLLPIPNSAYYPSYMRPTICFVHVCRKCNRTIRIQRAPIGGQIEDTRDKWNVWLKNIVDGRDPTFRPLDVHLCEDGNAGVTDIQGISVYDADVENSPMEPVEASKIQRL